MQSRHVSVVIINCYNQLKTNVLNLLGQSDGQIGLL